MSDLLLCADDFGQSEAVSQGILDCLLAQRLSATSCMTSAKAWPVYGPKLREVKCQADIGLHFNLTHGAGLCASGSLSAQSLSSLILRAYTKRLDRASIARAFCHQLDQFGQVLGRVPDFIDGHQHVHQLPVVRDVILRQLQENSELSHCYIRSTTPMHSIPGMRFKSSVIANLGGYALKAKLIAAGIAHNRAFSGVYDFGLAKNYRRWFKQFLVNQPDGLLVMCHPGLPSEDESDPLSMSRRHEYEFLMGDAFESVLALGQWRLCRFNQLMHPLYRTGL